MREGMPDVLRDPNFIPSKHPETSETLHNYVTCHNEIQSPHLPPDCFTKLLGFSVCTGEYRSKRKHFILLKKSNCSCKRIQNEKAFNLILI